MAEMIHLFKMDFGRKVWDSSSHRRQQTITNSNVTNEVPRITTEIIVNAFKATERRLQKDLGDDRIAVCSTYNVGSSNCCVIKQCLLHRLDVKSDWR